MLCTQCAAVSYSAAAKILVERGERCPNCGGPVRLAPEDDSPVTTGAKSTNGPEDGDD